MTGKRKVIIMATFNDKPTYAKNYYDVTGKKKREKGLAEENNRFSFKKLFIALSLVGVVFVAVGIASSNASSEQSNFNKTLKNNPIYIEGYNDGLTNSFDESNVTDTYYMDGYKDGQADQ